MNKQLVAQTLGEFYIYEADTYRTEYVSKNMTKLEGTVNLFFISDETSSLKKKKKTEPSNNGYIIEIEKTDELESYVKNKETMGLLFKNSLNRNREELFQVFSIQQTIGENNNRLYFTVSKFRNKMAMGHPIGNMSYENLINELNKNILYIIDRY